MVAVPVQVMYILIFLITINFNQEVGPMVGEHLLMKNLAMVSAFSSGNPQHSDYLFLLSAVVGYLLRHGVSECRNSGKSTAHPSPVLS